MQANQSIESLFGMEDEALDSSALKKRLKALDTRNAELVHANRRLAAEVARLKKMESMAGAGREKAPFFLASIGHEIRTPVSAILTLCKLAVDETPSPRFVKYLNAIQASGQTLLEIVNGFSGMAEKEVAFSTAECRTFRLSDLLVEIRRSIQIQVARRGLELVIDPSPDIPETIAADRTRLKQVLLNLLFNALKFTPAGQIRLSVSAWQEGAAETLRFTVSDTGIGMDREAQHRIFEPFFQAEKAGEHADEGSGLGLFICKRFVEAMGGEIWAESGPGRGSDFHFTLPVRDADASTRTKGNGEKLYREKANAVPEDRPHRRLHGYRVLLVEDHPVNRSATAEMLRRAGLVVETAEDGEAALAQLDGDAFDAVLMDVRMPRMNGFETTREIRRRPHIRFLPVLAMTADAMPEDRGRCLAAGMDDYIAKPVDFETLFTRLESLLRVEATERPSGKPEDTAPLPQYDLPERIEGLNIRDSVERMMGNERMYLDALRFFRSEKAGIAHRFRGLARKHDLDTIEMTAHALKGSSTMIGAETLAAKALALEKACKANDIYTVHILIDQIDGEMALLSRSIHSLRNHYPDLFDVVRIPG